MAVHATGAELIGSMRDDAIDLGAILNAINEHTRIVFIANPNNSTGTMLDASSVDRFVSEVPGHVVVVLTRRITNMPRTLLRGDRWNIRDRSTTSHRDRMSSF